MTQTLSRRGLLGVASVLVSSVPALADTSPMQELALADPNTIRVIGGPLTGTTLALAADLAEVLDAGSKLRVLPIVGKGSMQNIADLMQMHGIDVAIAQSDILAYAQRRHMYPSIAQSIQYITKLYDGEVHVLVSKEIKSLAELAHKRVNCDVSGGGTSITGPLMFETLGIPVEITSFDQDLALEKLKQGEIAAAVWLVGKPAKLFSGIAASDNLHFLTVAATPELLANYLPSQLTHAAYPTLVAENSPVDTIAVGYVMATYAWKPNNENYRRLSRFVTAFFEQFDEFRRPPRHSKWQEVSLGADVPGWTRFPPAQEWLGQHVQQAPRREILQVEAMTDPEKERLLHELQVWHQQGNLKQQ